MGHGNGGGKVHNGRHVVVATTPRRMSQVPASASGGDVPGMGRRQFMNLLTFGSVTGVALGALYPVVNYFIPPPRRRRRRRHLRQG